MKTLRESLRDSDVIICDGGMGTLLQQRGLAPADCPELWCVDRPEDVKAVHRDYRDAGSRMVECNSFGASRLKLDMFGLGDRVIEINRSAAALAREVAGDDQYVLGSMGPTGRFLEPVGETTEDELYSVFREQVEALAEGGADAVIVETMTALDEALVAARAARDHTDLVVVSSLTFEPQVHGGYATMMGVRPDTYAAAAAAAGVDVIGTNCGTGADHMVAIVKELRAAAPGMTLLAMPNAGMPVLENGQTVFKEPPEEMAQKASGLVDAGVTILGGCCGTGPEHIAAMRRAVCAQ